MNAQLHPVLALALLPMAPKGSVVHKALPSTQPVDPKIQQDWDRALKLQQELPECLRGVM